MGFTNTFGNSPIAPADVAFRAFSINTSTQLLWPAFAAGNLNTVARFMNVTANGTNLVLTMPDATLSSNGMDTIICNVGANSFSVSTFAGVNLATIAPGTCWYVALTDNSSQGGAWTVLQFGAGNSAVQASQVAGNGLLPLAGLLNLNLPTTSINTNFNFTTASRAVAYVWTGGAGTGTLPAVSSVNNGFFTAVSNQGTGNLTIGAADDIDGSATSVFAPGQSGFIVASNTTWNTVGKGTPSNFAITLENVNVAGGVDVTISSAQAQNVIQQLTGLLTASINVKFPTIVQLYIINNQTSGPYSVTIKTVTGTGVAVPQGGTSIVYCDGTNIVNAFSFVPAGNQSYPVGSATVPSLSFQGFAGSGLYSPGTGDVGVTVNATTVMWWTAQASAVNYFKVTASAASADLILAALGTDGNISIDWTAKGSGAHKFLTGGGTQAQILDMVSAVNYLTFTGGATTFAPTIAAAGSDANINMIISPKGAGLLGIGGTSGVLLPTGTTGQRVGTVAGTLRYSTSLNVPEGYFNGGWTAVLTGSDNLASLGSASTSRTNLGLGTAAVQNVGAFFQIANNLSDGTASTMRTNLGLGTAAVQNTGTSGANLPLMNGTNTWAGTQDFTGSTTKVATQLGSDNTTNAASTAMVQLAIAAAGGTIKSVKSQVFTGSGTYTPSTGMAYCKVRVLGGGASGSGSASGFFGSGGGAGGYAESILSAATVGVSQSITINAAAAGVSGTSTGNTGGNVTFGSIITCNGGVGGLGTGAADGGVGGTASGGNIINVQGNSGCGSTLNSARGGYGANSQLGAGGIGSQAGTGYGSGGAATANGSGTSGAGSPGIVIIMEFCTQ